VLAVGSHSGTVLAQSESDKEVTPVGVAENKKLIRDVFDAWSGGDGNAFFNILAEDVKWTVIGSTPISRMYQSRKAFLEGAAQPLGEKINGAIRPTIHDIIAEDDRIAVQWEGHATGKNGTRYDQVYSWVMRIQNGKVVEGTAYLDTDLIVRLWK